MTEISTRKGIISVIFASELIELAPLWAVAVSRSSFLHPLMVMRDSTAILILYSQEKKRCLCTPWLFFDYLRTVSKCKFNVSKAQWSEG